MDKYDRLASALVETLAAKAAYDVAFERAKTNGVTSRFAVFDGDPDLDETMVASGESLFKVLVEDFSEGLPNSVADRHYEETRAEVMQYLPKAFGLMGKPKIDAAETLNLAGLNDPMAWAAALRDKNLPGHVIGIIVPNTLLSVLRMPYATQKMPSFDTYAKNFNLLLFGKRGRDGRD